MITGVEKELLKKKIEEIGLDCKAILETKMIYNAEKDGWNAIDFHSRCDDKGPTLVVIQTTDFETIGGFTVESWESPLGAKNK